MLTLRRKLARFLRAAPLDYNHFMPFRRRFSFLVLPMLFLAAGSFLVLFPLLAQKTPRSSAGRILLLPRTIVSGDRATLAVLDANGRLTPGAKVEFSNGDRLTTDATGRALFVAPLSAGVIQGSIAGREGRVSTTILAHSEMAATAMQVDSIPEIASITDRFEIDGKGFCGTADANHITISGEPVFVLASSPTSLVILPPADLQPGRASVDLSCRKLFGPPLEVVFVALSLEADSSPLTPGVHRILTVRVSGTREKVELEAKNLAPGIASLTGGNVVRASTSGDWENLAHFEVIGRKRGSFQIAIRLLVSNKWPQ
jgi:hypothetical protein